MRGDLVNLNINAFNKKRSGLIVKCLEIPRYAYSSRYSQLNKKQNDTKEKIKNTNFWTFSHNI